MGRSRSQGTNTCLDNQSSMRERGFCDGCQTLHQHPPNQVKPSTAGHWPRTSDIRRLKVYSFETTKHGCLPYAQSQRTLSTVWMALKSKKMLRSCFFFLPPLIFFLTFACRSTGCYVAFPLRTRARWILLPYLVCQMTLVPVSMLPGAPASPLPLRR